MNFKYFIAILYLSFVGLIIAMVFKSCAQNLELETENYYAEELKFQEQIDARIRGNVQADSVIVFLKNNHVITQKPNGLKVDSTHLEFKKPDNSAADRNFVFYGNQPASISKDRFLSGVYHLKIRYFIKGEDLLIEKKIKL